MSTVDLNDVKELLEGSPVLRRVETTPNEKCLVKKLDQYFSDFEISMMWYGGEVSSKRSEQERIAFCNRLLVECLDEFPYREEFIKHFSAGGDMKKRRAIAALLARDTYISMGDIVDAVFHSTRDPSGLMNHAGENGVR